MANLSSSLTAQAYDDLTITPNAPRTNLVKTSMVPGGNNLGEKLRSDLENLKVGESLFIPEGTYNLGGWTGTWQAPDRPLHLVGEPGTLLVFPDNGFDGLIYLKNNIKIWDIDFRGPTMLFLHTDDYMEHAHFYRVDTENITNLFVSREGIRADGPLPEDDKVGEVVLYDSTATGRGPLDTSTMGLIKVTANFDAVLLANVESADRTAPLVYTGYEFDYDEGNNGPVHWRGPGDPDGPDQSGHGNTYLINVAMRDFDDENGTYNAVDLRYNNKVFLNNVFYETDSPIRGGDAEAIYIKAREVWGSDITLRNATNNRSDTEGAISLKRGIAYLENLNIDNNWNNWSGNNVGVGVVALRAVVDLQNATIANSALDTQIAGRAHTFFGTSESEAKQRLEQEFPDFDFVEGRPKLRLEYGDGAEIAPSPEVDVSSSADEDPDDLSDAASDEPLAVDEFVLVDADSDQRVGPINDGDVLVLNELGFENFSVVADLNTAEGVVDRVELALRGPVSADSTERFADYSLFGDNNNDYAGKTLLPGNYGLAATPYIDNGDAGTPLSVSFSAVEGSTDSGIEESAGDGNGSGRGTVLAAVNVGGDAVTGFAGTPDGVAIDFAADGGNGAGLLAAGGAGTYTNATFGGAATLAGSERWDTASGAEMLWQLPVAAGTAVVVDLYFAEIFYSGAQSAGSRVFDVQLENQTVLDDLDIAAEAGFGELLVKSFETTVDADGSLDLAFFHDLVQNPKINAIAVYTSDDAFVA